MIVKMNESHYTKLLSNGNDAKVKDSRTDCDTKKTKNKVQVYACVCVCLCVEDIQ